jgi:hypothetical protein
MSAPFSSMNASSPDLGNASITHYTMIRFAWYVFPYARLPKVGGTNYDALTAPDNLLTDNPISLSGVVNFLPRVTPG